MILFSENRILSLHINTTGMQANSGFKLENFSSKETKKFCKSRRLLFDT